MGRALICLLLSCWPAAAMVGGATAPPNSIARALVLIVGSRGNFCTGAALAPDLVLTAAHCVLPGADYKIVEYERGQPQLRDVTRVTAHPNFKLQTLLAHRATADVALLKLAAPLANVALAPLGPTPDRRARRQLPGRGAGPRGARRRQVRRHRARREPRRHRTARKPANPPC